MDENTVTLEDFKLVALLAKKTGSQELARQRLCDLLLLAYELNLQGRSNLWNELGSYRMPNKPDA